VYPTAARVAADHEAAATAADAVARLDAMLALIPADQQPPRPTACRALAAAEVTRAAGRPDPEAWRLAADGFRALSEPYTTAYAEFRQVEAALLAGDGDDARRLLEDAHAITVGLGERPLRAEIEALAGRAGVALGGS